MNKMIKKTAALCLALILLCSLAAAQAEPFTAQYTVTFGQSECRAMLDSINAFRQGSDAWYWNSDSTQKIYATGLSALTYDYDLERIAMQRAAECALHYAHIRTDGTSCFTAYEQISPRSYWGMAENIAAGYPTANDVFIGWREDNDSYDGQGHRRNMLNSQFNAVGIGHVRCGGVDYWAQEFSQVSSLVTAPTPVQDGQAVVSAQVNESLISSMTVSGLDATALTLQYQASAPLPTVSARLTMTGFWSYMSDCVPVSVTPGWVSQNESCVRVSNGAALGWAVGDTTLTAAFRGSQFSLPVSVRYDGLATDFALPGAARTVENQAFAGIAAQAVALPATVSRVEAQAFANCARLRQVRVASSTTAFDDTAFQGCSGLVFLCPQGSTAETFARNHGFSVVYILP